MKKQKGSQENTTGVNCNVPNPAGPGQICGTTDMGGGPVTNP